MDDHFRQKESVMRTNPAHLVYCAAKAKNEQHLKSILVSASIDAPDAGNYRLPAITQLAKEGYKEAVAFLLAHGAQEAYAAKGIAMSGNEIWLNELLKGRPDLLNFAAEGASLSGNQALAHKLMNRGANLVNVLLGAALGQHFDWVDRILSKPTTSEEVTVVAFAAAIRNDWTNMRRYQMQGGNVRTITRGIGIAGHWAVGIDMLEQNQQSPDLINELASGFAIGGHFDKALRLHRRGANVNYILFGGALSGYKSHCQTVIKEHRANIHFLLLGAASGGHSVWCESVRTHLERRYDQLFPERNHQIALSAMRAGFEQYAKQVEGNNLTLYPSDTAKYAELTRLLPDTFFCEYKHQPRTAESDFDSSFTLSDSSSNATFTLDSPT